MSKVTESEPLRVDSLRNFSVESDISPVEFVEKSPSMKSILNKVSERLGSSRVLERDRGELFLECIEKDGHVDEEIYMALSELAGSEIIWHMLDVESQTYTSVSISSFFNKPMIFFYQCNLEGEPYKRLRDLRRHRLPTELIDSTVKKTNERKLSITIGRKAKNQSRENLDRKILFEEAEIQEALARFNPNKITRIELN